MGEEASKLSTFSCDIIAVIMSYSDVPPNSEDNVISLFMTIGARAAAGVDERSSLEST